MSYNLVDPTTGDLTRVAGNAVNADLKDMNVYSTEEKIVGTWIDGKPIYRIVLTNTEIIVGDQVLWGGLQSTVASLNIDNCIECKGITTNGFRHIQFLPNDGFIAYYSGIERGGKIILEYTKTTD